MNVYIESCPLECYLSSLDIQAAGGPVFTTMEETKRIILAEAAPLLHEMLKKILARAQDIEIVQELHHLEYPPAELDQLQPDWLVISLSLAEEMPAWVDEYITAHASVAVVVLALDSNQIRLKWAQALERNLYDVSLGELMHILRDGPQAG
jgi:DNA-binding NarL/FixJ family response regulator